MIPKIIHMYWDTKKIPKLIRFCIRKIKKLNPDFKVRIYDSSFYDKMSITKSFSYIEKEAHKADFVRLYILSSIGGVWIDASIIINVPLEHIIHLDKDVIQAYETVFKNKKNIETCFIVCPKSSSLMKKWFSEFTKACRLGFWEYHEKNKKYYRGVNDLAYLTLNACFYKVFHGHFNSQHILLLATTDSKSHLFSYLLKHKWDSNKAIQELCRSRINKYKIIKFRSIERRILEKELSKNKKCLT